MEGLYFEVKPQRDEPSGQGCAEKPPPKIISNRRACPSRPLWASSAPCPQKPSSPRNRLSLCGGKVEEEPEEEVEYRLTLIGSLPVHHLTTMAMLPWVVAEISRRAQRSPGPHCGAPSSPSGPSSLNQSVLLYVSASRVCCVCVLAEGPGWDPLTRTVLFECRPHQVTKLIHNSQEPGSFGCLVREDPSCSCYVFRGHDSTKVGGLDTGVSGCSRWVLTQSTRG